MLPNLPTYIPVIFGLTTITTLVFLVFTVKGSRDYGAKAPIILVGALLWLALQMILSLNGFYSSNTTSVPPRALLQVLPALVLILVLFRTQKGKSFIDSLPLSSITYTNVVRVPVEFVLYWLFLNGAVPELQTFSGINFDILAGITAPFIAYFGLQRKMLSNRGLLIWNIVGLCLLLWIITIALLSAPLAFQQLAFDQPNIAVLYFPFVWLPGFVVPVVLFGHLVSIRQLLAGMRDEG